MQKERMKKVSYSMFLLHNGKTFTATGLRRLLGLPGFTLVMEGGTYLFTLSQEDVYCL